MNLTLRIKTDLIAAMTTEVALTKSGDDPDKLAFAQDTKNACRSIISRYPELGKKAKDITDEEVMRLCKKIIKEEKGRLLFQDKHLTATDVEGLTPKEYNKFIDEKLIELDEVLTSRFISCFEKYLPPMISEASIKKFINDNVDFSKLKSPMQAIGIVKNHFGESVDGKMVKAIIDQMKG